MSGLQNLSEAEIDRLIAEKEAALGMRGASAVSESELDRRIQEAEMKLKEIGAPSKLESAFGGVQSTATLGLGPKFAGLGEALGDAAGTFQGLPSEMPVLEKLKHSFQGLKEGASRGNREFKKEQAALREANPKSYIAGQVAGGVLASPMINKALGLNSLGGQSTLGEFVKGNARAGALVSATESLGSDAGPAEAAYNILFGTLLGAGGGAVAKGLQNVKGLSKTISKEKAEDAIQAAKELGVEPTLGMRSGSEVVQGLESSLSQSPTFAGTIVRRAIGRANKQLQDSTEGLVKYASNANIEDIGDDIKATFARNVGEKSDPHIQIFDELARYTKDMPVGESSRKAVARSIENIDEVRALKNSPWGSQAKNVAETLVENTKSVADIKRLRGVVGRLLGKRELDGNERATYAQIYKKLSDLEQRSIKRSAIQSARTSSEGKEVGTKMLTDLKGANKGFSGFIKETNELLSGLRMKPGQTRGQILDRVSEIPDEQVAKRLWKSNDYKLMNKMKEGYPELFDKVRGAKVKEILEKSTVKEQVDVKRFVKEAEKFGVETQKILFGDDAPQKIKQLRKVLDTAPRKIGPSGTPEGEMYRQVISPLQLTEMLRFLLYKSAGSGKLGSALSGSADLVKSAVTPSLNFMAAPNYIRMRALEGY